MGHPTHLPRRSVRAPVVVVALAVLVTSVSACTPVDPPMGLRRERGGPLEMVAARCDGDRVLGATVRVTTEPRGEAKELWSAGAEEGVDVDAVPVADAADGFEITGDPEAVLVGPPDELLTVSVGTVDGSGTAQDVRRARLPEDGALLLDDDRPVPMSVDQLDDELDDHCPFFSEWMVGLFLWIVMTFVLVAFLLVGAVIVLAVRAAVRSAGRSAAAPPLEPRPP